MSISGITPKTIASVRGWFLMFQLALASQIALGQNLLNLDFGVGTSSNKQGPAAIGESPADFWNHYSRDDGAGGFRISGELSDLTWADGRPSPVDLTVVNAPGAWGNESSDPMFGVYLYPGTGQNITVTLSEVPSGTYTLYVYAHGVLDGENGVVEVASGDSLWGPLSGSIEPGWNTPSWEAGRQYVRFESIRVGPTGQFLITVRPGTTGLAVINGLQLLRESPCASPPPDLVAWWRGEGDVSDVLGVNGGELRGGLGFGSGQVGQAFDFTAEGQHVFIPASAELMVQSLTIEAWIKPATVFLEQPIVEYSPVSGDVGVHLWLSVHPEGYQALPGSLFANVISADGVSHFVFTSGDVVQPELWSHVALTYDVSSGYARILHNGIEVAAQNLGTYLPRTDMPVFLGHRPVGNSNDSRGSTFSGQMDEVSIYGRALSAAEIKAIYDAGADGKCVPPPSDCVAAPPGILAWWRGEGDGRDEFGRQDGQVMGAVYDRGRVGQALVFDGVDDYVRIPFAESLKSTTFSVEAWIQPLGPVVDSQWNQDFVFGQALGSPALLVRPGSEGVRPVFTIFVHPFLVPEVVSSVEIPLDQFSHVAGTYDGATLRIYVDGVLTGESVASQKPIDSTCDFYIGGHQGSCAGYSFDGGYFHGAVDELSLYHRALTPSEIDQIYLAGSDGKCPPPGYALTVVATPGGSVLREPDFSEYRPGDTVTLTAVPEAGFAFVRWEGDVTGTDPEATLRMEAAKEVAAVFVDVAPPVAQIDSPTPGVTGQQSFVLSGNITDNVEVISASWEWNNQSRGALPLDAGAFRVEDLQFVLGENRIRVLAVDAAGNQGAAEVLVEWVPGRLLLVVDPESRQEGQRIQVPILLTSAGDVGGASFVLRYNTEYLKQPVLEWAPAVDSALNQVNLAVPGEVRASFALPALPVPAGTEPVAVVTYRARSVPANVTSALELELLGVSNPMGDPIFSGSAARSGVANILVRRVVGDNNANDRLDVGDATIVQRLFTGLEPVRSWDVVGNDLNQNALLDSGDIIRVLRAAVGLDPQPSPQSAGTDTPNRGLTKQNLEPQGSGTVGTLELEADRLRALPGELVTVRVRLAGIPTSIAAAAMSLEYAPESLRLMNAQSHRVGDLVPGPAVAIWNVAPAQNDYALQSGLVFLGVSSALAWPTSDGVLAEFSFQVQASQTDRYQWPIRVRQAEYSADGYDLTPLPDADLYYIGRDPLPPQLTPASGGMTAEGFAFSFLGETGVHYLIEVSSDLTEWTPLAIRAGADELIMIVDPAALGADHRFYRVQFE